MRALRAALAAGAAGALVLAAGTVASGQGGAPSGGDATPVAAENPCHGPKRRVLACPNLRMRPPSDLFTSRTRHGRRLLHATNSIDSRGAGPAELRGRRASGKHYMEAVQAVHRRGSRKVYLLDTDAYLGFKHIPDQGGYWKFKDAARFEIWTLDPDDRPQELVRVGPKQYYCLRDLVHTRPGGRSPGSRVYPGCNQDPRRRRVTLGTSVGWSDVYPSTYHEQYIDVTGLRGRYGFLHVADPENGIWETSESDNAAMTIVSLPSGRGLGTRGPMPRP
ncbi:MAG TPA: hypothetical protein VF520_13615 [Thermoleophilaceae bacterium]|jgi:hypothetical protein